MEKIKIETEYIKLDAALKFTGIAMTGGEGKIIISEGCVSVNGEVCTQRGKKLRPGDVFTVEGENFEIV